GGRRPDAWWMEMTNKNLRVFGCNTRLLFAGGRLFGRPECLPKGGGFNRSAQHLLILRGEEVCHYDVPDLVHGRAEGRAVGAMEEGAKCCGHLAGTGKEEQDRR